MSRLVLLVGFLLALVGLLVAGALAYVTYRHPEAERPIMVATAGLMVAVAVVAVVAAL
ncbi:MULTISPECIES: hypothetical protein [unclassified Streptomyces]|uniref:hypothetical protein n=1 Tax=Streptomyces sp. NPDC055082 TaxID=3365718 RepID=UPI0037D7F116